MKNDAEDRLSHCIAAHGRVTAARWWVLHLLESAERAMTPDELVAAVQAATPTAPDRVTIYRTLEWLVEQGLARRIAASHRAARFEATTRRPAHGHIVCRRCGATRCLDTSTVPLPPLPPDWQVEDSELVVQGLCPECSPGRVTSIATAS